MPIDYSRYPDNWLDIRAAILDRANHCCEQCGVRNHATIVRKRGTPDYLYEDVSADCVYTYPNGNWIRLSELPDGYDYDKSVKVILTIHHIGIDLPNGRKGSPHYKMDCRPENLLALCQRCHLLIDLPLHIENNKNTRARKRQQRIVANGQLALAGLGDPS